MQMINCMLVEVCITFLYFAFFCAFFAWSKWFVNIYWRQASHKLKSPLSFSCHILFPLTYKVHEKNTYEHCAQSQNHKKQANESPLLKNTKKKKSFLDDCDCQWTSLNSNDEIGIKVTQNSPKQNDTRPSTKNTEDSMNWVIQRTFLLLWFFTKISMSWGSV